MVMICINRKMKSDRRKFLWLPFAALLALILAGCGKSGVNVDNAPYIPKIVVEGYLYCGQTVGSIRLMRNFPIGAQVDTNELTLTPSGNDVKVSINGTGLSFDPRTQTYYTNRITVGYGQTYTLDVSASVAGVQLHTASTTTTPQKGFTVLNKDMGGFPYDSPSIAVSFLTSPGTGFYAFSIVPDSAGTGNFIYDNVYRNKLDSSEVAKDLNDLKFRDEIDHNIDSYSGMQYLLPISSSNTWFYGKYTVVGYAGDTNFEDYVLTAPNVQQLDGNFHEPVLIFQGDGIGVFASAIVDTATFTIMK